MRIRILAFLMLGLLGTPALADTVDLSNGGVINGTVDLVVFETSAGSRTLPRGSFSRIFLGLQGADTVTLDSGEMLEGSVKSIQIRSVGGVHDLSRDELTAVTIVRGRIDDVRKEYLAKRAAVKNDDAKGLFELAAWCKENSLDAEMHDLAERCIQADPKSEAAKQAHELLGHEFVAGQWIVPEPEVNISAAAEGTSPAEEEEVTQPKRVVVAPEVSAAFEALSEEFAAQVKKSIEEDKKKVIATYAQDLENLKKRVDAMPGEVKGHQDAVDKTYDEYRKDHNKRPAYDDACKKLTAKKAEQAKVNRAFETLVSQAKDALAVARARARQRQVGLDVAKSRIERLLLRGQALDEGAMRAIFEESIKTKD